MKTAGFTLTVENCQQLQSESGWVESFENRSSFELGNDIFSFHYHINGECGDTYFFYQMHVCYCIKTVVGTCLN